MKLSIPILLIIFFLLAGNSAYASRPTDSLRLSFVPFVGTVPLMLDTHWYPISNGKDSIRIETFRFYISSVQLYKDGQQVWTEPNSFHLLDASIPESMTLAAAIPPGLRYDKVVLTLGIDSLTNAKGIGGGDLDPVKGMYWAWQSGYINMKIEGMSPACTTRKHAFQYHMGGFLDGNACAQMVSLPAVTSDVHINIDLGVFFRELDIVKRPMVMIPGKEAIEHSVKAAKMFTVQP